MSVVADTRRRRRLGRRAALVILAAMALVTVARYLRDRETAPAGEEGAARVERAFAARESGLWVQVEGRVVKLLRDDTEGSRHQRFIVRLPKSRDPIGKAK